MRQVDLQLKPQGSHQQQLALRQGVAEAEVWLEHQGRGEGFQAGDTNVDDVADAYVVVVNDLGECYITFYNLVVITSNKSYLK